MEDDSAKPERSAAFVRLGPSSPASPVVLSVPHAGRDYSPGLLSASRLSQRHLESLEDRYVDRLTDRALATGAAAIIARRPRAEIDLNRDERELDPSIITPPLPTRSVLPSARTRGGLGLIPSRIGGVGPIWQAPIDRGDLFRRISAIHRPYHAAVAEALVEARARFGAAVLIDCHSMPPRLDRGSAQAEVVFGDLHGSTIAPELLEVAVATAREAGFRIACNTPYAGGYITARHGRPSEAIHAVQIEIDRSLYLDGDLRNLGTGYERVALMLAQIVQALAARAIEPPQAIAAE